MRVANIYFLVLLLLQLIPEVVPAIPRVSSVGAATTIIPLVIVLGVTAVKDAFDDIVSCADVRTVRVFHMYRFDVYVQYVRMLYRFDVVAYVVQM